MPSPTGPELLASLAPALSAVGCPGAIVAGVNPWMQMIGVLSDYIAGVFAANLLSGVLIGTLGGVTATVAPPTPVPSLHSLHLAAAASFVAPSLPAVAAAAAGVGGWAGPLALAPPTGVAQGLLSALTRSSWSWTAQPTDPVYLALTTGVLQWVRPPLTAPPLVPGLQQAWVAALGTPGGPTTALVLLEALVQVFNAVQLSCTVVNPGGVGPVVPGTPYPPTLPPVIT